jgi:hypothetical protein
LCPVCGVVTCGPQYPGYKTPTNLFNYVLQKASTRADTHYLDVRQPAYQDNVDVAEKLVSISFYSYAIFVMFKQKSIFGRTDIWRS